VVTPVWVVGGAIEDTCGVGVALADGVADGCGITLGDGTADGCGLVIEDGVADLYGTAPGEEQAASTVVSNRARMPTEQNLGIVLNIDCPF